MLFVFKHSSLRFNLLHIWQVYSWVFYGAMNLFRLMVVTKDKLEPIRLCFVIAGGVTSAASHVIRAQTIFT